MKRTSLLVATSVLAACSAAQSMPKASMSATAAPRAVEAPVSAVPTPAPPPANPQSTGFVDVNTDNSLISNGSVAATSEHLLTTASAFRREVYRLGGRVYAEQVHYRDPGDDPDHREPSSATYRIKILPRLLPDLLDFLGKHADITSQDVSSIVAMESEADAAIVRADVQQEVGEIDSKLADPNLDPAYRTALETERAKLIGATIADPNATADNTKRVAVLDVRLDAPRQPDVYAHGKMFGHARGSFIDLGVLSAGSTSRLGGGIAVGGKSPVSSVEVIGYAANTMDEKAGVVATVGVGGYSKALGGGAHSSFNPYLGARVGYAYLDASYLAVAAEVGVELVKQHGVLWTVSARPMGLLGSDSKAAVEVGSSVGLAF